MSETKQEVAPKSIDADFSPEAREELRHLRNLEGFMRRVKGIDGDEAFAYIEARKYVATKANILVQVELAKLKAAKSAGEVKTEEAPLTPPTLKVVPPAAESTDSAN